MNRGNILLRVDGPSPAGLGRVARCLALANALQRRRYQMTFLSRLDQAGWSERIRRFRHSVSRTDLPAGSDDDLNQLLQQVSDSKPVMVITDDPNIDEEYLARLSHRVPLVIAMSSVAKTRFPCDLVLNPTMGQSANAYDLYPGGQVLAGAKYAMVRSEFRRARNVRGTEPGGPKRALVCLGAGERCDDIAKVCNALLENEAVEKVDAILGGADRQDQRLRDLDEKFGGKISFHSDARDLGIKMTKCHVLVSGGGNTALEAACVGVPMVLLTRHKHHELNAERLEDQGVAVYLGSSDSFDVEQLPKAVSTILNDPFERRAMSRSGRVLIDGRGADRLVTASEILLCRSRQRKVVPLAA